MNCMRGIPGPVRQHERESSLMERSPVRDSESSPETVQTPAQIRYSFWQWLFSFPAMLCALLVALTVLTVRNRFNDPDMWWHLKIGETIWRTHSIPRIDTFSFTAYGHAWTAHEWLAQLSIYGAWKLGGETGLMVWLCVFASLLVVLLYAVCALYSDNAKISLIGALTGWFFATVGLAIRPLVIGFLLLVLELLIVQLARLRTRRWLIALPPLFAIWVNCHGSYVVGLMVLGVLWACSFFELSAGSLVCSRWPARDRRWLAVSGILSVAALALNPVGVRILMYPFDLFMHQSNGLTYVTEWQPLSLNDNRALALLAVTGAIFLMSLLRRSTLRLEELVLMGLGGGMAISHQRMVFVFGIFAAPVVARVFAGAWERYDPRRDLRVANAILIFVAIFVIVLPFPSHRQLHEQAVKTSPVEAVDYIRHTGLAGPMLNDYDFGGYLIWALPEQKVFIDGRSDVYDWTGVFSEMARWALVQEDPNLLLNKYKIKFCILRKTAPMAQVLPLLQGWNKVYSDDLAVIFVRSG